MFSSWSNRSSLKSEVKGHLREKFSILSKPERVSVTDLKLGQFKVGIHFGLP